MRSGIAVLVASSLLLTGCGSTPLPEPLTDAQIEARIAQGNEDWWDSMFPGEPMPVVEMVEYVSGDRAAEAIQDCMEAARIEGVIYSADFSWIYLGDDQAVRDQLDRQYFICNAQYPYDPAEMGFLSDAQLKWNYYYHRDRLVPCLQLLGYGVVNRTSDYVDGSGDYWNPYYEIPPQSEESWARIDLRCPPSPIGPVYRPTHG